MSHRIVVVCMLLFAGPALAHDACKQSDWIGNTNLRNEAGESCCGIGDCGWLDEGSVAITRQGYSVHGNVNYCYRVYSAAGETQLVDLTERIDELVPFSEAQPSPDRFYWRCKKAMVNGVQGRRCFLAPPMAY